MDQQRVTLAHVAAQAGVSLATVSKVLNARPDISPATRERVEQVLRTSGYVPQAQRKPRKSVRSVSAVFDDVTSPYSGAVLRGILAGGAQAATQVVLSRPPLLPDGGPRHDDLWVRELAAAGHEGVVVVTSELTEEQLAGFDRQGLPLVVVDPVNLQQPNVVSVGATNWAGGVVATEHLIGLGHKAIAFVGGPRTSAPSQQRLYGYRAALDSAGLPFNESWARLGSFSFDAGFEFGMEVLAAEERPTAIFAASDVAALGILKAAYACGLNVPGQLSVIGFDDTELAKWSTPSLTTIRQPLEEMGQVAIRTVLAIASGGRPDSTHVEMATQLVIRETTAPPVD